MKLFKRKDEFQWEWAGFRFGEYRSSAMPPAPPESEEIRIWILPYRSIVIPLTILSGWLLLGKPRAHQLKHVSER